MKAICRSRNDCLRFIDDICRTYGVTFEKPLEVSVKERKSTRSLDQNKYLWGVCYATILKEGGLAEQGWRADDLHEFFLGECYGWESLQAFNRKRLRPVRRSSKMNKAEFSDFIAFIHQKAAEVTGVVIPDPE